MNLESSQITLAVLGGTGKEGKGLAFRWARAGYNVIIGSRAAEKAEAAAQELTEMLGGKATVTGMDNPSAAQKRFCANGRSFDAHNTTVFFRPEASWLNFRTEVAQTGVSMLGKIFSTRRLPR